MRKDKKIENKLKNIPEVKSIKTNVSEVLKTLNSERNTEKPKIKISFQFFDRENKLFNLGEAENEWFIDLLDTLKLLTDITKVQLFGEYKQRFRPHPYNDIDKLNYKDEILTNPQYEAWQLRITKSKGRIHGFFVQNTYYIRFIDRWHNMYDDEKYGGSVFKEYPNTMYDMLNDENEKQKIEIRGYKQEAFQLKKKISNAFDSFCENCSECPKAEDVFKVFDTEK